MNANPLYYCLMLLLISTIASAQLSELSEDEKKKLIHTRIEDRIRDLEINIQTITDKEISKAIRRETINACAKYFVDEGRVFQVSNHTHPEVENYRVRHYLLRILIFNPERIEIKSLEVHSISDYRHSSPDGKYYGTLRVFKVVKNLDGSEGWKFYRCGREKDIEVDSPLGYYIGDQFKEVIDVRFGDIHVIETHSDKNE
ncbi:hypothetical protein [Phaeodactylibacter xiamenensis]|uniref:hypothetical protein n=1 Tax=Phaeodactylibacter xiamenensis TaxID=1524460 RepID=UPI0024A7AAAA|nr:hypothetical protein [Phaeodactylibacter xiamenensis]